MHQQLPSAIRVFLASHPSHELCTGGEVEYLRLARLEEVSSLDAIVSTSETPSAALDPYGEWFPSYEVQVLDLVVSGEPYGAEGLVVWVPKLGLIGSLDVEHGTLFVFPDASWADFIADPRHYLDSVWHPRPGVVEVLPLWLTHTCCLEELGIEIEPYPKVCPVHKVPVGEIEARGAIQPTESQRELLLRNRSAEYFEAKAKEFPCSLIPASPQLRIGCGSCTLAEDEWLRVSWQTATVFEVTPTDDWVKCPFCAFRFKTTDGDRFRDGCHTRCGARIQIQDETLQDNQPNS